MNDERKIDEAFLDQMMKRSEKAWEDVPDATAWVEELRNGDLDMTPQTERDAYICKYCDGVYADDPVTRCDCLGYINQDEPHFIKGKIIYIKTK
jgi:hypothetical protein